MDENCKEANCSLHGLQKALENASKKTWAIKVGLPLSISDAVLIFLRRIHLMHISLLLFFFSLYTTTTDC